jgi:hypothetical protein
METDMTRLSHSTTRLSIGLLAAAALAIISGATLTAAPPASRPAHSAPDPRSPYFGRWTVHEDKPVFSSRGKLYRTIDIAPCGRDFCGVSVDPAGKCGATLFRFLMQSSNKTSDLRGHGLWGNQRKNLLLTMIEGELGILLGDGYDFSERSGNGAKFDAGYSPAGAARCIAR